VTIETQYGPAVGSQSVNECIEEKGLMCTSGAPAVITRSNVLYLLGGSIVTYVTYVLQNLARASTIVDVAPVVLCPCTVPVRPLSLSPSLHISLSASVPVLGLVYVCVSVCLCLCLSL